jgi:[acyl-carrier-protein] S-malonyltransferase
VRWQESVRALAGLGIRQLIECGPGKVLTAMNRRIERRPDLACLSVEDSTSLDAALSAVRAP